MNQPEPVVLHATETASSTPCFDFEDMQVLREEYEEKLRRVTTERDGATLAAKNAAEARIARMQQEHLHNSAVAEARRNELLGDQRQLIEELTIELAAVREALATMVAHAVPAEVIPFQQAVQAQQQAQALASTSAQTQMRKRRIRLRR